MFFIGIFGADKRKKDIKVLDNLQCKNCEGNVSGKLIKVYSFFHIFFIPLYIWDEHYYIVCNRCKSVYEIPKEKGKEIEKNRDINLTYWDLKLIENNYKSNNYVCEVCGSKLEDNFEFCPYCGNKIK